MEKLAWRIFKIKTDEIFQVIVSFLYFFTLLASYYVLRPIRDEMMMQMGSQRLQENFLSVFLVMLTLVPLFGWITKKYPRRKVVPRVYGFFAVNLIIFYLFFQDSGLQKEWIARSFFVWVSVYNLFVISVFWSFMADIFSTEQSSRLNGFISGGGTAGALIGPLITAVMVESIGTKNLVIVSCVFLMGAIGCVFLLRKYLQEAPAPKDLTSSEQGFQGNIFSGLLEIVRSKYLLGICVFLFFYAILSTFLYGMSTELLPQVYSDPIKRTKILAQMDLAVNILSLFSQIFLFGRVLNKLGRKMGLLTLPILSVLGFALFGLTQSLALLLGFGILRRAGEYSVSKPTRETLFNALTPIQKYRAKNIIDTLVHRTGDVTSAFIFSTLQKTGAGLELLAWGATVIALIWSVNSYWLGGKAEAIVAKE